VPLRKRGQGREPVSSAQALPRGISLTRTYEGLPDDAYGIGWSADGSFLAAAGSTGEVVVWDVAADERRVLNRPAAPAKITALAWHPFNPVVAVREAGGYIQFFDMTPGKSPDSFSIPAPDEGEHAVRGVAWSPDGLMLAVTDTETMDSAPDALRTSGSVAIWDMRTQRILRKRQYSRYCNAPCWSRDGGVILAPGADGTIKVHASDNLDILETLRGHDSAVFYADLSPAGTLVASASVDSTVRVWELTSGKSVMVFDGWARSSLCVKFSPDGNLLAATTGDAVQLWRCRDWQSVATIPVGNASGIGGLAFHPSQPLLAVKDRQSSQILCYSIDYALLDAAAIRPDSRRYVNAKVVLLGDTGVGKSGLGLVLGGRQYQPTDSTHGRRVWTFDTQEVEAPDGGKQTREVLLWDLAGQPGYRLVHQLHLNEIAVALLVFDSRSEIDPFSGVKHWVRALAQARRLEETAVPLRTYLVAARADRGGVPVSRQRIQAMIDDLGLDGFFETSAKEGWQITELTDAIKDAIGWDALPIVSSSVLFDSIKQFLVEEKEEGRVLCAVDDLFRGFLRAHPDVGGRDTLRDSFETCIGRVESRDLIRRLHFGGLVLLQPELLDAYASALVQAAKDEPDGLGFIREADALDGRFRLSAEERITDPTQEKLLLIATVEELLRHEIVLKEATDQGVDLIFPSQFTRERPDAPDIPGRQVTFAFEGPLHSIYASLAVRLAHSSLFRRQTMWQNAASYTAAVGGTCGIHLRELEEGHGELALFYDEQAGPAVRGQFETYVAEHLQLRALPGTIVRRAIRSCLACGYVLPDDLVQGRLTRGSHTIRCPMCDDSVISLHDDQPSAATAEAAVSEMNRSADEQRDRNVAATRLKGKVETGDFDVFLCHNSKDKAQVMAAGERLKERGILPWLDIWEIRPGVRWQQELRRVIKSVKTVAVFIGPGGAGPWQELEVESVIGDFARRGKPIIPVILEGRQGSPRLPAFLSSWHKVDMRNPSPDPFEQLVWGITGERSNEG
jgi:WD40 repeat protein